MSSQNDVGSVGNTLFDAALTLLMNGAAQRAQQLREHVGQQHVERMTKLTSTVRDTNQAADEVLFEADSELSTLAVEFKDTPQKATDGDLNGVTNSLARQQGDPVRRRA